MEEGPPVENGCRVAKERTRPEVAAMEASLSGGVSSRQRKAAAGFLVPNGGVRRLSLFKEPVMSHVMARELHSSMSGFWHRFGDKLHGMLSGFDRLRLRGTRRLLAHLSGLKNFLWQSRVLLTDFDSYVQDRTATLCNAVKKGAEEAGRPLIYVASGEANKGDLIDDLERREGVRDGLIAVLSCVEPCASYEIHRNKETRKLELRPRQRKCLHYYHYYRHPQFGLMHTRLQTWLPFTMHICLNGREWLARQLDGAGIDYRKRDNCFVSLGDIDAAQNLMDQQLDSNWPQLLDGLARTSDSTCDTLLDVPAPYYWTVDQSEWATDILFRSSADLHALYPRFLRHGIDVLRSEDVLRFLGRRLTVAGKISSKFNEEVVTSLQKRPEGTRLKHTINSNGLKMYDKAYEDAGAVLRLEATYNNVRNIKVFRPKEGDPEGKKAWRGLRKGVADLSRRAAISRQATERYAEALATVEDKTPLKDLTEDLCRPVQWHGRQVRALQPLQVDDATLLETINRGEFLLDGFRNRDLRKLLYEQTEPAPPSTPEDRRRAAAVTRKIRLLRAHGLIQKVPKSHRYQVTEWGRTAIAALIAARHADTAKLTQAA
jgi:hypothetical protein